MQVRPVTVGLTLPRQHTLLIARRLSTTPSSVEAQLTRNSDGISFLSLNRPSVKNALSVKMLKQMRAALEEIRFDSTTRALIVQSSTPGIFCAGADLKERRTMSTTDIARFLWTLRQTLAELETLPMPTFAAIDGPALGGGFELALSCDFRVAGELAKIGLTETKLAIIPGAGGTQRLSRLVGPSKAKELIFSSRICTPSEAADFGMVNAVSSAGQSATDAAIEMAQKLLPAGPLAIRAAKLAIDAGSEMDMESALDFEHTCYQTIMPSKDRLEGLKAWSFFESLDSSEPSSARHAFRFRSDRHHFNSVSTRTGIRLAVSGDEPISNSLPAHLPLIPQSCLPTTPSMSQLPVLVGSSARTNGRTGRRSRGTPQTASWGNAGSLEWNDVSRSFELVREMRPSEPLPTSRKVSDQALIVVFLERELIRDINLGQPSRSSFHSQLTPPTSPSRPVQRLQATPPPSLRPGCIPPTPLASPPRHTILDGRYPREARPRSILQPPLQYGPRGTLVPLSSVSSGQSTPLPSPQTTPRRSTPSQRPVTTKLPPTRPINDPFLTHSTHILRPTPPTSAPSSRMASPQPSYSSMSRYSSSSSSRHSSAKSHTSSLHPRAHRAKLSSRITARPASRSLKRSSGLSQISNRSRQQPQIHLSTAKMTRQTSDMSASVYSQDSNREDTLSSHFQVPPPSPHPDHSPQCHLSSTARKRMGSVYAPWSPPLEMEVKPEDDLMQHWRTFVAEASPLLRTTTRLATPEPQPVADAHDRKGDHSGSPTSRILPNTLSHLQSRLSLARRAVHNLPQRPGATVAGGEMTRVDSQVALARLALKRLDSTNSLSDKMSASTPDVSPRRNGVVELFNAWERGVADDARPSGVATQTLSRVDGTSRTSSCDTQSLDCSDVSRLSIASTTRTSVSLGELELNLEKFARELDLRLDDLSEEDDYVCALDLIAEDFGSEEEGDQATRTGARGRYSLPPSSSSTSLSSRIPRPASMASLKKTPSLSRPSSLVYQRRSSIPVRSRLTPAPSPPVAKPTPAAAATPVATPTQMRSWAKARRYTRPMR